MSFFIRAKSDISRIEKKVSNANIKKGKNAVADQVLLDAEDYIPKKDGDLRASGHVERGGESVSWDTVYARAQYYGTNGIVVFNEYTTPGTDKLWYEKTKKSNIKSWKRIAAEEMGF